MKGLPTGADKSGVTSQAITVPQGTGKIQGMGESFSAQLSTGIATFSIPFALPSARGGAQPSLSLSYSSSGGHGVAGVGWEIGAPFIARQTDRGLPSYTDGADWTAQQDRFVFNGGQELVPICLVTSGRVCSATLPAGEVMPEWAGGWQYFRPRVEGSFLRFFWSADHKTWKVQSKSGETMELGVPDDGSGYVGGLETDPANPSKIFRWNLTRHYDAQRLSGKPVNVVAYRYVVVDGVGYLTDVYDTPPAADPVGASFSSYAHHARLRYDARPDPTFSFRRGWRTAQTLRLVGVDVTSKTFVASGARELVRRYHLTYDAKYHVSLLTSVQMEGRCATNPVETDEKSGDPSTSTSVWPSGGALPAVTGCPTLPAMTLGYQHVEPYTSTGAPGVPDLAGYEGFDERPKTMAGSPPYSLDEDLTDLFDVNADGLPDVLVTAGAYFGGDHGVFFNGLGGASSAFGGARTLPVRGEAGLAGADSTTIKLSNLNVVAGDVDSNGFADLLHMPKVKTYGVYTPRLREAAKDGYEWEWFGRKVTTASALSPKIDFGKDAADIRLMDVNGDGLVDAVYSAGTELQTFFSLGRYPGGFGQFGSAKFASASTATISNDPVSRCVPWAGTPVRWSDSEIKIADMNGDGLPDIVKLQKGKIEYWPGRGDGTWGTGDPAACKAGTFSAGTSIVMTASPWFTDPSVGALRVDDVNGDGLDDLVQIRFTDVDVWLNVDGVAWTARHVITGTPASPSYLSRTRLVDVNGSGTRDVLWGDGLNYRYIDLLGGKRPWVLTKVENGLGKTTELEYATSTQLMLAAEAAGSAWKKKAPLVQHVVVKETIRDNLSVAGRPSGAYVTQYTYKDPVYDGLQREFRGFETTTVTRVGDENSPTAYTKSTFLLGECRPTTAAECQPEGAWMDHPREGLKGLPVVSETYDAAGVYLQTQHHTYTLRQLYTGRDGRGVMHAYESESNTFLYDNAPFTKSESARTVYDVAGVLATSTDKRDLPLHSFNGRVLVEASTTVDSFGNAVTSTAKGCTEGCSSADEVITTTTTPARPTGDTSGWLFRTVTSYVTGNASGEQRHRKDIEYDSFGNPTKTKAVLSGSIPLDRFHASADAGAGDGGTGDAGPAIADAPENASLNGTITLDEAQYDTFGNLTFAAGANGRCRSVEYDATYSDLATRETVYVGPATSYAFAGASFSCGNVLLVATADYDRGLELITVVTDVRDEKSKVDYDGFGRVVALYKPDPKRDPGDPSVASADPSIKIEYLLASPVSRLHTSVQDHDDGATATYREAWAFVDGLGRTVATLDEADIGAGDEGGWVVNGFTDYDAKGAPRRAFLARFYNGSPESFSLSTPTSTRYGRKRYDAFGRDLQSYGLDGQTTLFTAYHALSADAWDAADLTPGPHYGTPASERKDGHGRTVAVTERAHVGAAVEEREIRTEYLPTGEVSKITRVRAGTDPLVRWMKYDSLGRMVFNAEPNTTKNFNPDPAAFTGATSGPRMIGWRYVYNDAGDLVGTSDARGCGTNYAYDTAGRLVSEDYSPCLPHHPPYSAPDPLLSSGYEVFNRYDVADSDANAVKTAEPACVVNTDLYKGRLYSVSDRGAKTVTVYDGRGRVTCVGRQMAKPGVPADSLYDRYADRWYVQYAKFDRADRPVEESTGAKVSELLGGDDKSIVKTTYSARGSVKQVAGSYGTLVSSVVHDADGLTLSIGYADAAGTKTEWDYDDKRRLRSVQTYRLTAPSIWSTGAYSPSPTYGSGVPSTFQLVLENLDYSYDVVDNPVEIRDWRVASEWPAGAKPVTRKVEYDDLYRVTKVGYQYAAGDDTWVSPFAPENAGTATDPRLAKPSPHVAFDKRVLWQSFSYDWLGNTTKTDDDAHGFYDRSLGAIVNGTANAGPYQLKGASSSTGTRAGSLTAKYDDAGYLVSLAVQRGGPCLPTGAVCGQRFIYDWDEVGRLQRARRWDLASPGAATDVEPTGSPAVELRYQYNAADQRTLKTAVEQATGDTRHTAYVFASLELRRTTWSGTDYARGAYTEVPYLFAHGVRLARVAYEDSEVPNAALAVTAGKPRLHVFLELGDHLGSSSTVLDLASSELVEKSTYHAYGAAESDYRPGRWKAFREDHRFTGKEEDVEVGLQYFGFRYLSASLGRWASADPLATHMMVADPNLYSYVRGRLLGAVDRYGLDEDDKLTLRPWVKDFLSGAAKSTPIGAVLMRPGEGETRAGNVGKVVLFSALPLVGMGYGLAASGHGVVTGLVATKNAYAAGDTEGTLNAAGATAGNAVIFSFTLFGAAKLTLKAPTALAKPAGKPAAAPPPAAPAATVAPALKPATVPRAVGADVTFRYVGSSKHGNASYGTPMGVASPAPKNGQAALDLSIRFKETTDRRVGIDYDAGEYVVFDPTHPNVGPTDPKFGEYHGHVRSWDQLDPAMQAALQKAGMADKKGKILRGPSEKPSEGKK
ncbi:MAG: hypothetical protein HYV09_09545 [Deltaproteobacteria bacterium]|nr:hypothetical protein [Deltaproteobacteria bacterium]